MSARKAKVSGFIYKLYEWGGTVLQDISLEAVCKDEDCVLAVKMEEDPVQRQQNIITGMDRIGVEYKRL